MKNNKFLIKMIFFLVLLFVLSPIVTSCSKNIDFQTSTVIPAARGNVAVKKDNNNNYSVKIEISYLAEPQRLDPPKKYYIVWLSSEENQIPLNIGQVVGTNKLHAKFQSVSTSKPERIFITAEDEVCTQNPGKYIVLQTDKF